MQIDNKEILAVERAINNECDGLLELNELELATVGGGTGAVSLG